MLGSQRRLGRARSRVAPGARNKRSHADLSAAVIQSLRDERGRAETPRIKEGRPPLCRQLFLFHLFTTASRLCPSFKPELPAFLSSSTCIVLIRSFGTILRTPSSASLSPALRSRPVCVIQQQSLLCALPASFFAPAPNNSDKLHQSPFILFRAVLT